MALHSPCAVRARIIFSAIGVFVGFSIFFTFGLMFNNWDAAVWGLASGVFAAMSLGVHITYRVNEWTSSSGMLPMLMYVGCFGQLAGLVATVVYIVLAVVLHQAVTAEGKSYYVTAVWSAMTWKWAFLLFLYSRRYRDTLGLSVQAPDTSDTAYQKI